MTHLRKIKAGDWRVGNVGHLLPLGWDMSDESSACLFTDRCSLPREITMQVRRAELVPLRGILLSAGLENLCSTNVIFQVMKKFVLIDQLQKPGRAVASRGWHLNMSKKL